MAEPSDTPAEVAKLRRELGQVTRQLADADLKKLADDAKKLEARVTELKTESDRRDVSARAHLMSLGRDVRDLTTDFDELESEIAAICTVQEYLIGAFGLLASRLHAAEGTEEFDFDAVDDEITRLAKEAEAYRLLKMELLDETRRGEFQQTIESQTRRRERLNLYEQDALAASVSLARSPYGSEEHSRALQGYAVASRARHIVIHELDQHGDAERDAELRLHSDDEKRSAHAEAIRSGESANVELRVRLRARLTNAIRRGAVLPLWLEVALDGLRQDDELWTLRAVELLAYRVTYGVVTRQYALDRAPEDAWPASRRGWYEQLQSPRLVTTSRRRRRTSAKAKDSGRPGQAP